MIGLIRLEFYKLRRKNLPLMIILFLGVELAWAFMAASKSLHRNPDSSGWEAAMVTLASMNGLFLPIVAAVVVSRIGDMEHKGNTWKLLMAASADRYRIYAAKYVCACSHLLLGIAVQAVAVYGFGRASGWAGPIPVGLIAASSAAAMVTSMVVIALQQWLSLAVQNQAFALSLGMLGGFIGMTADLFPAGVRRFFIWSYYTGLSPVTSHYTGQTMELAVRAVPVLSLAVLFLLGIAVYAAGSIHVSRQDV